MAPDTTGIRAVDQARSEGLVERAMELAEALSTPGGGFVAKIFQGPAVQRLVVRARAGWERVTLDKPDSSRKQSTEIYIVATGRRR
jgi:23S rRNA (uridine2552-2'-O)-methyltransferase